MSLSKLCWGGLVLAAGYAILGGLTGAMAAGEHETGGPAVMSTGQAGDGGKGQPTERDEPGAGPMSVRGIHCFAPSRDSLAECEQFILEVLPKEGVNLLVLEFRYFYQFKSHPEIGGGGACGEQEVKRLLAACREARVKLVPQMNCLGHQRMDWARDANTLLEAYPEFDEAPHIPQTERGQKRVKCYCPRHPELHAIVFDLMDELIEVCEADAFHVGMDEVFNIADEMCPRCAGEDPAVIFAEEVSRLHDHLAARNVTMWMWGDRLIDARAAGVNTWEGSANGTNPAVDMVPKDVVICDWHYENVPDTARYFIDKGFRVLACPWNRTPIGLGQLDKMRELAADPDPNRAARALGMVQTTWMGLPKFAARYPEAQVGSTRRSAPDAAKALFRKLQGADVGG